MKEAIYGFKFFCLLLSPPISTFVLSPGYFVGGQMLRSLKSARSSTTVCLHWQSLFLCGSFKTMFCCRLARGRHVTFHTWGRDKIVRLFPDDISKCIFMNENAGISIKIALKFVPKVMINIVKNVNAAVKNKSVMWLPNEASDFC